MARPWWQRLCGSLIPVQTPATDGQCLSSTTAAPPAGNPGAPPAGGCGRNRSRCGSGIVAAAKAVPALLTAWTFNTPDLNRSTSRCPAVTRRLALLCEWGLEFGGVIFV